ncbi:MAG: hypothetical protein V4611_02240 [Patescibacteria group bacterium]
MPKPTRPPISLTVQLVVGFIIPTIILMTLSNESRLGPLAAMGLALLPPVLLEVYSFITGHKASWLSLFAIIGILLIGVISLFGLSEEWLGVRRAGFYIIAAAIVAAVLLFKREWIDKGLGKLIDMPLVRKAAKENKTEAELSAHISKVGYLLVAFLIIIAIWSYILTIIVINAPTGSSEFNTEYAQLRLLGIPFVSGPLLLGMVVLLVYLVSGFEKLTGIDTETLLKKKDRKK